MLVSNDVSTVLTGALSTPKAFPSPAGAVDRAQRSRRMAAATAQLGPQIRLFDDGFEIDSLKEDVVAGLDAVIRESNGILHGLSVAGRFHAELETVLGRPGDKKTIAAALNAMTTAFAALAANPTSGPESVTEAAQTTVRRFRDLSLHIQSLRTKADRQLADAVTQADSLVQRIGELNSRISLAQTAGKPTPALEAERGRLVQDLAPFLDFAFFSRGDGALVLVTCKGTPLIGPGAPHLCAPASPTPPLPGASLEKGVLSGVTAHGIDIGKDISTGRIGALLKVRDTILPNLQAQIDTLAQTLQARLNQIGNRALGTSGARGIYTGSRSFPAMGGERITLTGGDCVIQVLNADKSIRAAAAFGTLMKRHRAADSGASGWTAGEIVSALDSWLRDVIGKSGSPYVRLDEKGRFSVRLDQGLALAFHDQRSVTLVSTLTAPAGKALGLAGRVAFSDSSGARFECPAPILPTDDIQAVAGRLSAIDGIEASTVPAGKNLAIRVTSQRGLDLIAEPDRDGGKLAATLDLRPDPSAASEDVAVSISAPHKGSVFTSRTVERGVPLGLKGALSFVGDSGASGAVTLDPAWDVLTLARRIGEAGIIDSLNAALSENNGRVALKLVLPAPASATLDGADDGFCSQPVLNGDFAARAGTLVIAGADGREIGRIDIGEGMDLNAIAEAVNTPSRPLADAGITAHVRKAGALSWLEIAARTGGALLFQGSAVGMEPGQLDFALNPRDSLRLIPAPSRIVPGLANYLGLNDLFVAEPSDAFDAKAPTGVFASTAIPGTAMALALNPADGGSPFDDAGTIAAAAEMLAAPLNIAAAGGLPRMAQRLDDYAAAIIAAIAAEATASQGQVIFRQSLLDGLSAQKNGLPLIDIDDEIRTLGQYRQAHQDCARVIASMTRLIEGLAA